MHYHHHHDQVVCDGDHDWPEWAHALFATLFHIEGKLMSQQDQINSDVQVISDALTAIGNELTDFKNQLAAQVPSSVDLSQLDALAQRAKDLAPQVPAAADTPVDPQGGTVPPPDLSQTV